MMFHVSVTWSVCSAPPTAPGRDSETCESAFLAKQDVSEVIMIDDKASGEKRVCSAPANRTPGRDSETPLDRS